MRTRSSRPNRPAVRCSIVEAASENVVGVGELLAADDEALIRVPAVGHRHEIRHRSLDHAVAVVAGRRGRGLIGLRRASEREEGAGQRGAQKEPTEDPSSPTLQTIRQQALHQVWRQHEQQADTDKHEADAIHLPRRIALFGCIVRDVELHGLNGALATVFSDSSPSHADARCGARANQFPRRHCTRPRQDVVRAGGHAGVSDACDRSQRITARTGWSPMAA